MIADNPIVGTGTKTENNKSVTIKVIAWYIPIRLNTKSSEWLLFRFRIDGKPGIFFINPKPK